MVGSLKREGKALEAGGTDLGTAQEGRELQVGRELGGALAQMPQRTARRSLSPALGQLNWMGTEKAVGKHNRSPEDSPQKEKGHKRPVGEAQAAPAGGEVSSPIPAPSQQDLTGMCEADEAHAAPAGGEGPSPTSAQGQQDLTSTREVAGKHERAAGNTPEKTKGRRLRGGIRGGFRGGLRQFQDTGRQAPAAPTCEEAPLSADTSRVSETSSAESGVEGADFPPDH